MTTPPGMDNTPYDIVGYSPTGQVLFQGNLQPDGTVQFVTIPPGFAGGSRFGPDGVPNHVRVTGGYFTPEGGLVIQTTDQPVTIPSEQAWDATYNYQPDSAADVPLAGCTYQVRQDGQTLTYRVGLDGPARLVAVSVVSGTGDAAVTIPAGDGTFTVPPGHVVTTDDSGHVYIDGVLFTPAVLAGGSGPRKPPRLDLARLEQQAGQVRADLEGLAALSGALQGHADAVGQIADAVEAELDGVGAAMGDDPYVYIFLQKVSAEAAHFYDDWPANRQGCVAPIRQLATVVGRLAEQLGYTQRQLRATEQANLDTISSVTGVNVRGLLSGPPRRGLVRGGTLAR